MLPLLLLALRWEELGGRGNEGLRLKVGTLVWFGEKPADGPRVRVAGATIAQLEERRVGRGGSEVGRWPYL